MNGNKENKKKSQDILFKDEQYWESIYATQIEERKKIYLKEKEDHFLYCKKKKTEIEKRFQDFFYDWLKDYQKYNKSKG